MRGIQVEESSVEQGNRGNEEEETSPGGSEKQSLPEYCLDSAYDAGVEKMAAVNYVEVRNANQARRERKRKVAKFILKKVKELERELETTVGDERTTVAPAPWTMLVHGLDPLYYN